MLKQKIGIAVIAAAWFGCIPEVSKAVVGPLPVQRAQECRANCSALGMELTSVVLIMNSTGCVCQVLEASKPATAPASAPGASAIIGGAAIAVTAAAAQHHHQQQPQPQHYTPPPTHY